MIKKLCATAFALLICISAFAGNPLKINGKDAIKAAFKEHATALISFDWDEAQYNSNEPASFAFKDDYEYIVNDCEKKFIETFNARSKGLKLSTTATDATYHIVFKVTNLDKHVSVTVVVPRFESKVWGHFTLTTSNGEEVGDITIDAAEDGKDFVIKDCYGKTFLELAKKIVRL